MGECKRLKDPIYGYIDIPSEYMYDIVDTASFQRLRRVIQTSYSPLYSSAVHNRFVHSLGVYHLGEMAITSLSNEIEKKVLNPPNIERMNLVFLLACLLHDVGHAPFSHTGESFYLNDQKEYTELHAKLIESVSESTFTSDVPTSKSGAAAPHEIMSVIVALQEYSSFFINKDEKSFFARCITGYKYSGNNIEHTIKNCYISLLNSKIIDVDKLDYLIRDSFITGFNTVNIDYARLLSSLTIINSYGKIELAYHKNAISVIENVVYAHDAERKWIQNHPIVLYENYILQHIISHLNSNINTDEKRLFSDSSLSQAGQSFSNNLNIKLLCDDDIIFLMKNVFPSDLSDEYFERKSRRHPIWKSESEYKAFFLQLAGNGELLENLETAMEATAKYLSKSSDSWVINNSLISKLEFELSEIEKADLDSYTKEVQITQKNSILKVTRCLQEYAEEIKTSYDFIILMASQFNSGFGKPDFSETNIVFSTKGTDKVSKFGKIVSSLEAKEKARESFFYLFYTRNSGTTNVIDKDDLCKRLFKEFI